MLLCSAVSESRVSSCGSSWDKNMEDLETVKRRVRKLLALSKSPNENEAVSALQKANALMAEYSLSRAEFAGYVEKSVKSTKRAVEWRSTVANAVERLYATYHYQDVGTGSFVFCGEELDVFMSTEMFAYLVRTIDRMARQNVRKNTKHRWRQSYRAGIASRLWDRMDELGRQCSWRNPTELAKKKQEISDWVNSQVALSKAQPKSKSARANMSAWNRGANDADGINLSRQMTGSGTRRIGGW